MIKIAQFLVESSFCLMVFYTFYALALHKETFFQLNRFYLLFTPLVSILIPLVNIELTALVQPEASTAIAPIFYPIIEETVAFERMLWETPDQNTFSIADLTFWIYLMGATFMSFHLVFGLTRLLLLIQKSKIKMVGKYKVITNSEFPASSFFSYVFWNKKKMSEQEKLVWEHELVHVKQWHSLDVLLMEIWVILKWFNPLIYFYRKSLRLTHEYIADQYVANQTGLRYQYALLLSETKELSLNTPIVNNFAQMLKKRLIMLSKKPSHFWKAGKYFFSIPLFGGMLLLFSFDLIEKLPTPIAQSFNNVENAIDQIGEKELTLPIFLGEEKEVLPTSSVELLPLETNPTTQLLSTGAGQFELDKTKIVSPSPKPFREILTTFLYDLQKEERRKKNKPPHFTIRWQDQSCNCKPGQLPNYYHCENQTFTLKEFRKIAKSGGFKLFKDEVEVPYDELQLQNKRMSRKQGGINQFDYQDIFNPKSKFWKELKREDILKFTFRSGINDYFHFDITINDKKESLDYAYDFYLGDIWVPVDMTSNIGIKYISQEEFLQNLKGTKVQVLKNTSELVDITNINISFNNIIGDQLSNTGPFIATESIPSLKYAKEESGLKAKVTTSDGYEFNISILLKDKKDQTFDQHQLEWGNLYSYAFQPRFVISEEEASALANKPMVFEYQGEKYTIKQIHEVHTSFHFDGSQQSIVDFKKRIKENCTIADFTSNHRCLTEKLLNAKEGDYITLKGVDTGAGHHFQVGIKIGTPREIHDSRYFAPVAVQFFGDQFSLLDPLEIVGEEGLKHIFAYRTIDNKIPMVKINEEIHEGQAAVKALTNLTPEHIKQIAFFPAGSPKKTTLFGEEIPKKEAVLSIYLAEAGSVKHLTVEKESIADEKAIRVLEDLGKALLVVINGEEKGAFKGSELIRVLKNISASDVENLTVLKGPEAMKKYGNVAASGAIIIRTKK